MRRYGYDAVNVQERGQRGKSDEEQLEYAVDDNRILVTFNMRDFYRIHNEWLEAGRPHRGILVTPDAADIGHLMRRLKDTLKVLHSDLTSQLQHF